MDRGIDGYLHFRDAEKKSQIAIVSVKGGATNSAHVRDLKGTMEREGAKIGIFLTLNPPTREMEREAASADMYQTGNIKVPRLQILTAAQVIDGRRPQVPFGFTENLKRARVEQGDDFARTAAVRHANGLSDDRMRPAAARSSISEEPLLGHFFLPGPTREGQQWVEGRHLTLRRFALSLKNARAGVARFETVFIGSPLFGGHFRGSFNLSF